MYSSPEEIPANDVALVLGASKYLRGNIINPYFRNRMQAAAELYFAGKVKHFIVSGENSSAGYNEPEDMKKSLMVLGVPERAISCDYAGFRTFDSVVRAWKIFGQQKFTIVSQRFHNERALYIARQMKLDCVAYNARDVYRGPASYTREILAKTCAVLDIFFLGTEPKFLGEPVQLNIQR